MAKRLCFPSIGEEVGDRELEPTMGPVLIAAPLDFLPEREIDTILYNHYFTFT